MNFFLLAILVYISPTLSEIREDFFLPFPKLRSIFSKLKKRQGDGGYLQQCGIVDFGERKLGTVNVLAFFDASWQYSHRQAAMLKELKDRFERSGIKDINFFVINSLQSTIIEDAEIEIEEETWKAISPTEAEGFPLVETSLESLNKTLGSEFHLIKDSSKLQIWKKLHVSRDQILVVDGCGKLTYQVIVPWSILHFPYVKAAILSTYKDEPCGPCKQEDNVEGSKKKENFIGKEDTTTYLHEPINDDGFTTTIGYGFDFSEGTVKEGKTEEMRKEEIKTDGDIKEEMESLDERTRENVRIDETVTITLETKETREEIKASDAITIMLLEIGERRREEMKTVGDVSTIRLGIKKTMEETTTEELKTSNGRGTTLLEIEETSTEQTKTNETTTIPLEIDETTEQISTNDTTISLRIEEKTTERMKAAEDITTIRLEIAEKTTEGIKTTDVTTMPSQIYETTQDIKISEYTTLIPLNPEETTEEIYETTLKQVKIAETTIEFSATTIESPFFEAKMYFADDSNDTHYEESDKKSEKPTPETETLKPTLDLENNNSEDLEHIFSKFPNVRSIPTESYENQITSDQDLENGFNRNDENSNLVPIRIIMKAPHLDIYENSLIKHDYLILKTGDPDFHDHFNRGIKIDSLDGSFDFNEGSADFEKRSDIWKIHDHDLNQNEGKIKINNGNKTKDGWYGFRIKIDDYDNDNKDSGDIKKMIFGKDESPGLYGEVADYWRNDGIENFYDEAFENEEDDRIYDMEKDPNGDSKIAEIYKSENDSSNSTEEEDKSEDQKEKNVGNSSNNDGDEEAKSKLIAHYSKLLPWIYYVLN